MALSAYDDEGRLKKHALQGTGLAIQTGAKAEGRRERFGALHEEARAGKFTREQMTDRLQGRFEEYGGGQQGRISQIAEKTGAMEARYAASKDPEAERYFQLYAQGEGGTRPDDFNVSAKQAWVDAGGAFGEYDRGDLEKRSFKKNLERDAFGREWTGTASSSTGRKAAQRLDKDYLKDEANRNLFTMTSDQALHDWKAEFGGGKYGLQQSTREDIARRNKASLNTFSKNRWRNLYDWKAARAYEERRGAIETEIDESYKPLVKESAERQALIEDRMEMYNLFLGE